MTPAAAAVRRVLLAPVVLGLTAFLWVTAPLWLIGTGVASAFVPGWLRPLRLGWLLIVHLTLESLILVELFGLWIASGFGLLLRRPFFERIHYDIAQAYLVVFFRESRRVLRLKVETVGPTPDAFPGHPLVVCCRHAGPGDSFTLMYALMHWYHREPRVVLKETLAWEPMVGVLLHRLPSRFISPSPRPGHDVESEIASMARDLDDNDAFVIFPEGGNFTPARRERSIARLRRLGLDGMADRAERMRHVLAPRPGGVVAALDAAPEADVLLVAHTGLDHVLTVRDVWTSLPMDKRIVMRWWRVPRSEIPADREARIEWLFDWWDRIDAWVEEHRPTDLPPRFRQAAGSGRER
ncbi:1-acyl-sn-glycerol-3-phosphate acyltransferase [Nocardioides donggukensis]|uniref:1-acyl-sn-glycerol-3-phosphate acyltransferase n=1 Tax=Nocardioides donggukensis TaxID=2774019 RepID=A0A927K5X1_9ACTN|nr:1-acyl-sn-glycerol-3-phosphate acyltransferase [Nocardioides donggukensis]MBD8870516.1 1-acyl-sn-glycerol-3-phosphate acyltransferase [Nocardioides donggukensis]